MRTSTDRILTTHVGSLPRPQDVVDLLFAQDRGEPVDAAQFEAVMTRAVDDVVLRQAQAGVDIASDGEMSKISYATYIADRFSGFDGDTPREPGQDLVEFPGLLKKLASGGSTAKYRRPRCVADIAVKNLAPMNADIANLRAASDAAKPVEAFMGRQIRIAADVTRQQSIQFRKQPIQSFRRR